MAELSKQQVDALRQIRDINQVPFLVTGSTSFNLYGVVDRPISDLDIVVSPTDQNKLALYYATNNAQQAQQNNGSKITNPPHKRAVGNVISFSINGITVDAFVKSGIELTQEFLLGGEPFMIAHPKYCIGPKRGLIDWYEQQLYATVNNTNVFSNTPSNKSAKMFNPGLSTAMIAAMQAKIAKHETDIKAYHKWVRMTTTLKPLDITGRLTKPGDIIVLAGRTWNMGKYSKVSNVGFGVVKGNIRTKPDMIRFIPLGLRPWEEIDKLDERLPTDKYPKRGSGNLAQKWLVVEETVLDKRSKEAYIYVKDKLQI